MPTVNIHEAKTHLSKLLARVARGEEVVVARAGRPVARLVPMTPARRMDQILDVPKSLERALLKCGVLTAHRRATSASRQSRAAGENDEIGPRMLTASYA